MHTILTSGKTIQHFSGRKTHTCDVSVHCACRPGYSSNSRWGPHSVSLLAIGLRYHNGKPGQNRYVSDSIVEAVKQRYTGAENKVCGLIPQFPLAEPTQMGQHERDTIHRVWAVHDKRNCPWTACRSHEKVCGTVCTWRPGPY